MDPNVVHRQFLPGYGDPATWSSILYNYGGQGPALHDLRADQPRALPPHETQRQQITGHDIAEFFARATSGPPPVSILNDCHLQPQPPAPAPPQPVTTTPHDVVLDLGLSAVVTPKKQAEPCFIQDAVERSRFDKKKLKTMKAGLKSWYKRSGCVTVALTYHDGQIDISGPDHMLSLGANQEFKNIFLNALTSYDQLSRLADIVSNCNEEDNANDNINTGTTVETADIANNVINQQSEPPLIGDFGAQSSKPPRKKAGAQADAVYDKDCKFCPSKFSSKHFLRKHLFEVHNHSPSRLVCTFCNKNFMTRWKLERHTISHTGAKPYNCIYCPKRFAEKNKLVVHIRNHKEDFVDPQAVSRLISSLLPRRKTNHECTVCGKSFMSSWKLKRHQRVHSGEKPYKCSRCPRSFIEKSKLDQHELLPHDGSKPKGGPVEKRHECDKCDKKFVSLWKLKRHALFHTGERPYQCEQCGKGFVEKNKLMLHAKFYHIDKDSPDAGPKKLIRAKRYECEDCNKKFATQWKLKRHGQTHSLERPFRCEICKRGFLTKNKLNLHNFTLHNEDEDTQQAAEMDNSFAEENEITVVEPQLEEEEVNVSQESEPLTLPEISSQEEAPSHDYMVKETESITLPQPVPAVKEKVTLTVTDPSAIAASVEFDLEPENPEFGRLVDESKTCGECGKAFKTPSRLKRHMTVHTGIRPFGCTKCDRSFTEKNKLVAHLKTHGIEDAKFVVEEAEPKTRPPVQQASGNHQCSMCDRSFVSPWKLKRHQTIHTGKKPFFCKLCTKAFAEKNKLENHFKAVHPDDLALLEEELLQVELTMAEPESAFSIVARTVDELPITKQKVEGKIKGENVPMERENIAATSVNVESNSVNIEINQCPVCKEKFPSKAELDLHVQQLHAEADTVTADDIKVKWPSQAMKKPLKYACDICGKSFITPSKLKRHSFSHGKQKPYKCKKCGKCFSENNKLFNHLLTHDKEKSRKFVPKIKLVVKGGGPVTTVVETSRSQNDIRVEQQPILLDPSTVSKPDDIVKGDEAHGETPQTEKEGKKQQSIDDHTYIQELNVEDFSEASPDMPIVAASRDIIRSNAEELRKLVDNALGATSTEGDDVSEQVEATARSVAVKKVPLNVRNDTSGSQEGRFLYGMQHVRSLAPKQTVNARVSFPHKQLSAPLNFEAKSQSAEISCQILQPKTFEPRPAPGQSSKMINQLHTCNICQQSFFTMLNLKQHQLVNHADGSEVSAIPKPAPQEDYKHKCTECGKGFKTPSKVKRHMLMHTGETPFQCDLCPKQFKRKDSLKKHVDEHNRGK